MDPASDADVASHASASNSKTSNKLNNRIGLFYAIGILISSVVGAGIFATPQTVYKDFPNASAILLIWIFYGIIALLGALCYAELGTTYPNSGGNYLYLHECLGPLPAFLYLWTTAFVFVPVSNSILAMVVATNVIIPYVPNPQGWNISAAIVLLSILLLSALYYLNVVNIKIVDRLQCALVVCKLSTVLVIALCGIVYIFNNGIFTNTDFSIHLPTLRDMGMKSEEQSKLTLRFYALHLAKAVYKCSYAYSGYDYLNNVTEEMINSKRNLPLAICCSIPSIIVIYVFLNFCYFAALPGDTIRNTEIIASDVFSAVLPSDMKASTSWIAPTIVAVAVLGGLTVHIMASSRIAFVGARYGQIPSVVSMVDMKRMTPTISLLFNGILACIFCLVGSIDDLIQVGAYLESFFASLVMIGLIYKRIKMPELHRPIKLPLALPITFVVCFTTLLTTPLLTMDENSYTEIYLVGGAVLAVLLAIPVYYLLVKRKNKPSWLRKMNVNVTLALQKTFLVIRNNDNEHHEQDRINHNHNDINE